MHVLNKLFNHIYILYIRDSEVASIKKVIEDEKVFVQYFLGVDGSKSIQDIPDAIKKGEFGHLSSFINILSDAKKNNYERILVLEPDIYFCENFSAILDSYELFISNTDILYLGCTQNKYYSEDTWPKIKILEDRYYHAYKTLGTFAISISNNLYDEIIKVLKTFSAPTDVLLTQFQEKYNSIVIYPNLISCNVVQSGTKGINNYRNQIDFSKSVRWNLRKYNYFNYYEFLLDESKIYEFKIVINSILDEYSILLDFDQNKIIIDDLRQLHLIKLADRKRIINKSDISYSFFIKGKPALKVMIKITNLFISNITTRSIDTISNLNAVYIRNNRKFPLIEYYFSKILS